MVFAFLGTLPSYAQDAKAWSAKETKLATEYLNLLVEKPETGRVLDLLWELYDKRGQTGFLLQSIAAQAEKQKHPNTLLIHAHLLRKAGKPAEAKARYEEVIKLSAGNEIALRALADLATEAGDHVAALSYLKQIAKTAPGNEAQQAAMWLQLGRTALAADKRDEAAAAWEQAAKLQPQNAALNSEVAQLLLGSGFPEKALTLYRKLAQSADPTRKLDALYDLSRLEEQSDHFDEAAKSLREGLGLLHFKDWRYQQFFLRLVKLHERFGRLDELKAALGKLASSKPPQEQALSDMAHFSALTVDAEEHMKWLRELTVVFPEIPEYRWELVRVLLDHEGAEEAARLLDAVLKHDGTDQASLVLLRCEAYLRQGQTQAAVERLQKLLATQGGDAEVEKQVLAFAQERALDAIVEQSLRSRIARDPGKADAVFELASFLVKRKKAVEARQLCDEWLKASGGEAGGNVKEVRQRLRQIASFFNANQETEIAEAYARRAASSQGGKDELADYADILTLRGDSEQALPLLERAWTAAQNAEDRLDVDERILALLSGEQGVVKPVIAPEPGSEFKLPAIFTGEGFGSDAPVQKRNEVADAVRDYALGQALWVYGAGVSRELPLSSWTFLDGVIARVQHLIPAMAAPQERILRAAWWCFRADEWQLAYQLLGQLHFNEKGQWITASVEAEKLLLDLALADQNVLLAIRQLRLLATLDAANRTSYLLRLADQEGHRPSFVELRGGKESLVPLSMTAPSSSKPGFAEAVEVLESLAKEEPQNEAVLSALSQFYLEDGRRDEALALWEKAASDAKGNSIPLLERYGELLLAQRKHKEFVEVQMRVISDEADVKRRRESFSRMMERLLWADVVQNSNTLPDDEVKKRLEIILGALQERSRRAPFEGFWHEALAAVYDKQGDASRAFAEMKQAYYTAPETPYSLDQLRGAALKVGDQKSAIYFQKQIAASAAPKDEAAEWRQLVTLLEQDFRMGEADQVRRRMEARFSQDPNALDELARHYADTGQEDAARRVQEQLARVRAWDVKNLLRLALQQGRAGAREAARKTLQQLLATSSAASSPANVSVERLSWPLVDERRSQAAAPSPLLAALENAPGLDQKDRDRLRAFLSLPRNEFVEVPEETPHVRLRAIEQLARLETEEQDQRHLPHKVADSLRSSVMTPNGDPMERAWALYYSGEGAAFRELLRSMIVDPDSQLEGLFVFLWLHVRSHGMGEAITWVRDSKVVEARRTARKAMLQSVLNMLADDATFEFTGADIAVLGEATLFSNTEIIDIARKLSTRQRHDLAMTLTAAAQRNSPTLAPDYALYLAQLAETAGRPDLEKAYLKQAWAKPLEAGAPQAFDPFVQSTAKLYRLARTPGEKQELLAASWARLRQLPPSGQGILREARLLGLAGAQDACAEHLAEYFGNGFLTTHAFIEPIMGGRLPAGAPLPGPRIDELNHLRGYWDDLREWSAILQQDGLAPALLAADQAVWQRNAGVALGPKSNFEFTTWRNHALLRELRFASHPQRLRLLRQYLESDDSVETLIELGGFLEGNGRVRDCVEIYRRLPERAFANVEYCEQFLRVCENSWECGIAIPYIERLFGAEPQFRPLNLAENLLEEKHALFLARLHDVVRLRLGAYRGAASVRALPGRVPAEVPYLRELALLLERMGDKPGALSAWEELCKAWPDDAEGGLHRARLLLEQGNKARALESVRVMDVANLWKDAVREALQLRVELASDAGLWDEVREIMNAVCGGTKQSAIPHTGAVISIARVLADHRRPEAQGLLLRAERAAKEGTDRFRLRLEQLKLLARDPAWQPQRDEARIASLARLDTSDEDALKAWLEFLRMEARGARAKNWVDTLVALPSSPVAALGLCAFGTALTERQASMPLNAWMKAEGNGTMAQKLAAAELLAQGRNSWALAVATSGRGTALRDSPMMIRVLHAAGQQHALEDLFARLVRDRFPGGTEIVEFCDALVETGHMDMANEICEQALEQQRAIGFSNTPLVHRYVRLLIQQRRLEQAETLMMKEDDALTVETAHILLELYRAWNKLDRLPQELAKFNLPDGLQSEVLFLAKAEKQKAE